MQPAAAGACLVRTLEPKCFGSISLIPRLLLQTQWEDRQLQYVPENTTSAFDVLSHLTVVCSMISTAAAATLFLHNWVAFLFGLTDTLTCWKLLAMSDWSTLLILSSTSFSRSEEFVHNCGAP